MKNIPISLILGVLAAFLLSAISTGTFAYYLPKELSLAQQILAHSVFIAMGIASGMGIMILVDHLRENPNGFDISSIDDKNIHMCKNCGDLFNTDPGAVYATTEEYEFCKRICYEEYLRKQNIS